MNNGVTKKYQMARLLFNISKGACVLGGIGFIYGLLQSGFLVGLLTSLVFFIPAIVCLLVALKYEKEALAQEQEQLDSEEKLRTALIAQNLQHAVTAYAILGKLYNKQENVYQLDVFHYNSIDAIQIIRNDNRSWQDYLRKCDCWIAPPQSNQQNGSLVIIETSEEVAAKVGQRPENFSDVECATNAIWHVHIPLNQIIHYSIVGNINATSNVHGGDFTYRGLSLNGIGFGTTEIDPITIEHQISDDRMIELVYMENCSAERILFQPDALPVLRTLIPKLKYSNLEFQ